MISPLFAKHFSGSSFLIPRFVFEEESSGTLGRGFRCGFLGMLHMEIITERLRREFSLELIVTSPSITYTILRTNGKQEVVYSPIFFPDDGEVKTVTEPWVLVTVIVPNTYVSPVIQLLHSHEASVESSDSFGGNRTSLLLSMPLRELMRGFFDEVKSASSGYASVSYEIGESREANVTRLDIVVADEVVPAFSPAWCVARAGWREEARKSVEKLQAALPRQLFVTKIQAKALLVGSLPLKLCICIAQGCYGVSLWRRHYPQDEVA